MKGQGRPLVSLLKSTLGGAAGWLIYLQVLKFTASALFLPLVESGRVDSIFLQVFVTAVVVFAAFSVLIAALSQQRWWVHWLAFVAGIASCIAMRFHPQNVELTIDVLRHTALIGAVLSSGIAAYLFSLYLDRDVSAET